MKLSKIFHCNDIQLICCFRYANMNFHQESQPFVNPWEVPSLDEFLFYCCPECDLRTKTSDELYNHAVQCHRHARVLVCAFSELYVKQEVVEETDEVHQEKTEEAYYQYEDSYQEFDESFPEYEEKYIPRPQSEILLEEESEGRRTKKKKQYAKERTEWMKQCKESDSSNVVKDAADQSEIDPLDAIPLEEMEDVPLLSPDLTRKELLALCEQKGIESNHKNSKQRLFTKLNFMLKKSHPAKLYIQQLQTIELQHLYEYVVKLNKGCHLIKSDYLRGRSSDLKPALIRYYFNTHPTGPLKTLKQHLNVLGDVIEKKTKRHYSKPQKPIVPEVDEEPDPSIVIPEDLSREQLVDMLKAKGIDNAMSIGTVPKLRIRLERVLKYIHPINKAVKEMSKQDLKVLIYYAGDIPGLRNHEELKSRLTKLCFEAHPEAPLTYLQSLLEEYHKTDSETHKNKIRKLREEKERKQTKPQMQPVHEHSLTIKEEINVDDNMVIDQIDYEPLAF